MLILSHEVVHSICLDTFCNANLDTLSVMFLASQGVLDLSPHSHDPAGVD